MVATEAVDGHVRFVCCLNDTKAGLFASEHVLSSLLPVLHNLFSVERDNDYCLLSVLRSLRQVEPSDVGCGERERGREG